MTRLTNPSSKATYNFLPVSSVAHDNLPTFVVVSSDTHLSDIVRSLDAQLLVNLVLNRKTVSIPAESSLDMVALLMRISSDNVFNGAS